MPSPSHPVASVHDRARLFVNPAFPAVTDAPSRTVAHTQTALLPPYPRAVRSHLSAARGGKAARPQARVRQEAAAARRHQGDSGPPRPARARAAIGPGNVRIRRALAVETRVSSSARAECRSRSVLG